MSLPHSVEQRVVQKKKKKERTRKEKKIKPITPCPAQRALRKTDRRGKRKRRRSCSAGEEEKRRGVFCLSNRSPHKKAPKRGKKGGGKIPNEGGDVLHITQQTHGRGKRKKKGVDSFNCGSLTARSNSGEKGEGGTTLFWTAKGRGILRKKKFEKKGEKGSYSLPSGKETGFIL